MKKKNRIWLWAAAVLLLLAAVGAAGVLRAGRALRRAWEAETAMPAAPAVTVAGQPLEPDGIDWTQDIFAAQPTGLFYRLAEKLYPQYAQKAGSVRCDHAASVLSPQGVQYEVTVPETAEATLTVTDDTGAVLYDGSFTGSWQRTFAQAGTDTGRLTVRPTASEAFTYSFQVSAVQDVTVELADAQVQQGDVAAVLVRGNRFGEAMTISTELGLCAFVPLDDDGAYAAFAPAAYNRSPGDYAITVQVGSQETELTVTVLARDFPVQYMTIDEDIADSTFNSATASAEYRAAIYPLYELADGEKYWDGLFIEPVQGYSVSTEYGLWRYTNGVYSERHGGVDLACELGTPVCAPQNGVVLFAGFLQMTGNTAVLSHGGGVKSMFYHMDSLAVETGDTVATGDAIGRVGTTGYSTGPHLHYEVKIGSQSIDPFKLFDGTGFLYAGQSLG